MCYLIGTNMLYFRVVLVVVFFLHGAVGDDSFIYNWKAPAGDGNINQKVAEEKHEDFWGFELFLNTLSWLNVGF